MKTSGIVPSTPQSRSAHSSHEVSDISETSRAAGKPGWLRGKRHWTAYVGVIFVSVSLSVLLLGCGVVMQQVASTTAASGTTGPSSSGSGGSTGSGSSGSGTSGSGSGGSSGSGSGGSTGSGSGGSSGSGSGGSAGSGSGGSSGSGSSGSGAGGSGSTGSGSSGSGSGGSTGSGSGGSTGSGSSGSGSGGSTGGGAGDPSGGGSDSSDAQITVTPATANLMPGQSQQLTAIAGGVPVTDVIWEVNGVPGGATASGTVSASGLYQTPSAVPTGGSVSVSAVSASDSTNSGTAVITIQDSVVVNPVTSTVIAGATLQLTATVDGSSGAAATWMVAGVTGGSATTGTISSTGLYTAPTTVPGAPVTITAVDPVDAAASATAQITVVPNPSVVQAQNLWLAGVAQAAATFGCTSIAVQQQPTETVTDAVSLFVQTAQEGSCLVLTPISTNPALCRYSFAWGGNVNGIDILYISDVGEMRIWNGIDVTGN